MDFKAIVRNLKNKGLKETLRIRKDRKEEARQEKAPEEVEWKVLRKELLACCKNRPFGELTLSLEEIEEKEHRLRDIAPKAYKTYKKKLKAHYLKTVLPARYAELADRPVVDKVVFMEKGGAHSAPNGYIASVIKKQGKYKVVKMGLDRNGKTRIGYFENCVKFVEEISDCKAIFISSANEVLSQFDLRPETKLIQLWHGLGMFKKCGYSTVDSKGFGATAAAREEYNSYRNYSYVCIPSMEQAWTFEDSMHISADSGILVPVGVSRTDVFYDPKYAEGALKKLHEKFPQTEGKKIIFYAPTYRGRVSNGKAPKALDVDAMARALGDEYVLLIKHHGFAAKDRPPIPAEWENTFAFDINANAVLGIEKLLAIADICITDYSSIGFEYALLERPILFFAFDLDDYLDNRGMYWDYDELTPGPVCKTTEEMIDYITHIDERFDKAEITAFKQKYVGACDGHATERTIKLIEGIVDLD